MKKWWWISFADGPPPNGFLGVAMVEAKDFERAIEEAWRRGINPGGEVLASSLVGAPPEHLRNRLLGREEAELAVTLVEAEPA